MNEPEVQIIACCPVSEVEQVKLLIHQYQPSPGAVQIKCDKCEQHIWIGPKGLAAKTANPEISAWCYGCITKEMGSEPNLSVKNLGGTGSSYRMADGHVIDSPANPLLDTAQVYKSSGICPKCKSIINTQSGIGSHRGPRPGDFGICIECASVLRINPDNSYRIATDADMELLPPFQRDKLNAAILSCKTLRSFTKKPREGN